MNNASWYVYKTKNEAIVSNKKLLFVPNLYIIHTIQSKLPPNPVDFYPNALSDACNKYNCIHHKFTKRWHQEKEMDYEEIMDASYKIAEMQENLQNTLKSLFDICDYDKNIMKEREYAMLQQLKSYLELLELENELRRNHNGF